MALTNNLKWGLRWGLTMAVAFTAIAVVASVAAAFDPTPRQDWSLPSFVAFYFIAGTCGGLVLGLLRPITRHKVGAMAVGTVIVAVALITMSLTLMETDSWTPVHSFLIAFGSLLGGPIATLMIWHVRSPNAKGSHGAAESEQ